MNNRFLNIFAIVACSTLLVTGCGEDNSSYETPNTTGTPTNDGLISQNNFTILFGPPDPKFYDVVTKDYTAVTSEISVQIGDNNNQLITGNHVINFRTEWGLIDPYCTTENGTCKVTWRSGSPDTMPDNYRNTIIAYTSTGQESFADVNGNGLFDDLDIFDTVLYADMEEPFINVDESYNGNVPSFTDGDIIIDTINGKDLTGANAMHDAADGFFNGPNCAHTTLCSTVMTTVTVWESGALILIGSDVFTIGGTVTGLTGTVVLQNNAADDLSLSVNGNFTFKTPVASTYAVTVLTQPAGQTCTVTNGTGTATANIANVTVNCVP
jgi:hypothetical protein